MSAAPPHSQIPLDLAPRKAQSFGSYLTSLCNAAVPARLKDWAQWPSPILLLLGETGTGKTHLGTAFAQLGDDFLFIDDAQSHDEAALFAQMNRALNGEVKALLLASDAAPSAWGTQLADLRSRLKNTPILELAEPDDALLELIVRDLFAVQGREVSRDVVTYIAARSTRTVRALEALVLRLEGAAQTSKADMTRAFVSKQMTLWDTPDNLGLF